MLYGQQHNSLQTVQFASLCNALPLTNAAYTQPPPSSSCWSIQSIDDMALQCIHTTDTVRRIETKHYHNTASSSSNTMLASTCTAPGMKVLHPPSFSVGPPANGVWRPGHASPRIRQSSFSCISVHALYTTLFQQHLCSAQSDREMAKETAWQARQVLL
jgi:hypothetical protein